MITGPVLQYRISDGSLTLLGSVIGHGYSGIDYGKNNPGSDAVPGIGPIPPGQWHLCSIENDGSTGPFTIVLQPTTGTNTYGRSEFRIHGDSISHPGEASHGCIILPREVREKIWNSGQRILTVID